MSRHALKYGDSECFLDVPDGCLAAEVLPNAVDLPSLPPAEVVRRALREPVDSPTLEAIVKPGDKVCIVIPDISRLWQSPQVYVPEVVAALSACGIPDADMTLLVATGRLVSTVLGWLRGPTYVSQLVYSQSLGVYNRQFLPNRTTADWISRDEQVVDTYLQDPFCTFTPTVGLYRDMLGGLRYISSEKALSRMDPNTPIYLFSGDQDPVGANGAGVRRVYGYFKDHGTRDLELKLYPGARHETLNETNRMEVYADVLDWLDRHCK